MGHNNHINHHLQSTTNDGLSISHSQRVNSPRFSGPMTRRAQSFKRNNNNTQSNFSTTIDLPVNSPRSDLGVNSSSGDGFGSSDEKKQTHVHFLSQRVKIKKHSKKLGQWMFLGFCGVCLFLGVFKICAFAWFGSGVDRVGHDQVILGIKF